MSTKMPSTYRAYCVKRHFNGARELLEAGTARIIDDDEFEIELKVLPLGGFDGRIIVRRDRGPGGPQPS